MRRQVFQLVMACILVQVAPVAVSSAQNTNSPAAFDFSLPGARSRAMGGAFVAVADDATSAFSNPAGLLTLFRPEVSIEGRLWNLTSTVLERGHAYGAPSGIGADTVAGLLTKDFHTDTAALSFLSFVYPRERWAAGIYVHQLAKYEMQREQGAPFFTCDVTRIGLGEDSGAFRGLRENNQIPFCDYVARNDGIDRINPTNQDFRLDIRSIGGAFAFALSPRFSVGLAVQRSTMQRRYRNEVLSILDTEGPRAQGNLPKRFADPIRTADNVGLIGTEAEYAGDNARWSFNAGILWDVSREWSIGAAFRQGPNFPFRADTVKGPANADPGVPVTPEGGARSLLKVPDTYAIGAVYRPSDFWRIAFEYDRVNYGQMLDEFVEVGNPPETSDPANPGEGFYVVEGIRIQDTHQFRAGVEYARPVFGDKVVALRGGGWHDPAHQVYFNPTDPTTGQPIPRAALYLPKGEDAWHYTAGVGFATRLHFQIDFAVDLSAPVDTYALSSVLRF